MTLYSFALTIHLTTLFTLIPIILYTDHLGAHWILKKDVTLPVKRLRILHYTVLAGLLVMIGSGLTLFSTVSGYLLTVPAFYVKIFFVTTLVINSFFIGTLLHIAVTKPFNDTSLRERVLLTLSGSASTLGWIGAILAATQLGL